MDIRLISDVHVEYYKTSDELIRKINQLFPKIDRDKEVLVIAGDIGRCIDETKMDSKYMDMLRYFAKRWKHVILVPGNHEWYGSEKLTFNEVNDMLANECEKLGIEYLNKDVLEKYGYVFVGCTLWSECSFEAYTLMNPKHKAFISHDDLISLHHNHRNWLDNTLQKLSDKGLKDKVIVITHHLPTRKLVNTRFLTPSYEITNSAYSNRLDYLIKRHTETIKFWFCGHSHIGEYVVMDNTLLFLNPIGNPWEEGESHIYKGTLGIDD